MISFYRKDYPRPQFVREAWKSLNGPWDFAFDDANRGEVLLWPKQFPKEKRTIQVPFTYETPQSGIGDTSVHNYVWYHRQVDLSQWKGQRLLLHFEGADYCTKVWADGEYLGMHQGGYSRFSFDISAFAGKPSVELVVKVWDSLDADQPRGKQRYKKESWGCWYVQSTGIWKTVWLEAVGENYLASVEMTPDVEKKSLALQMEAAISDEAFTAHRFQLCCEIGLEGRPIASHTRDITNPVEKIILSLGEQPLCLWSPEKPWLYEIHYTLLRDGKVVDEVRSYFGVRSFCVQKDRLLLNGKPIYLRLILDQGYWAESGLTPPSEDALRYDLELVRKFGYNGLRKHQKIEDERFLFWCDVLGILVFGEMAATYRFTSRAMERFTAQWLRIVRQNQNHPSIIVWVPFNESWGIPEIREDLATQNFVNSIYYLTKAQDPTRPVITNDGWEHTLSDIITIHDYWERGQELEENYLDPKQDILHNRKSMSWYGQLLFAEGYRYQGQPVLLSEYGGIALQSEKGWGYGAQAACEEGFLERFLSQNQAIDNVPYFSGFCYTQLTDVEQEVNGLVDMARRSKFTAATEARIAKSNRETGSSKE